MALRNDHRIMIEQGSHYTQLALVDLNEGWRDGYHFVSGTWKHTAESYNDEMILFTSAHPEHLKFSYIGSPTGGILNFVSWMNRGSHKSGEDSLAMSYVRIYNICRMASGEFCVFPDGRQGDGDLRYNARPHFEAGKITYTIGRYSR